MGFWEQYFSTILKGEKWLSFRERRGVTHVVRDLKDVDKAIFKKFPKLVEEEHKITAALDLEKKTIKKLGGISAAVYALMYRALLQEMNLINSVTEVQKRLKKIRFENLNDAEKKWVKIMGQALQDLNQKERLAYKDIMNILAETEGEHKTLRNKVVFFMNKLNVQNIIEKPIARREARLIRNCIVGIHRETEKIDRLMKGQKKEKLGELEKALERIDEYLTEGIKQSYYLKRRIVIWMIKVLYDFFQIIDKSNEYIEKRIMPSEEIKKEDLEKINKIFNKAIAEFRTLAQGFRVIIRRVEEAEKAIR